MNLKEVHIERPTGRPYVAVVVLDRPESMNGLTPEVCVQLGEAFESLANDESVRAVVITGAGRAFSSGLDLKAAAASIMGAGATAGGPAVDREEALRHGFHRLIRSVRSIPVPTIARIPGAAVGFGFDWALACDIRYGVADAKYGPVFTRIGLIPDGGGTWTLPRIVGPAVAMEMILSGRTFDGRVAAHRGVLNEVYDDIGALDAAVDALADHFAEMPPLALRAAKKLVRASVEGGTLEEALERECTAQLAQLQSEDTAAAIASFFTKKSPVYRGK